MTEWQGASLAIPESMGMFEWVARFLYKKEVDWSVLHEGFSIPAEFQAGVQAELGGLARGQRRTVCLRVAGGEYEAKVINQPFDAVKYAGHPDVLQVRYSKNSALAVKLREVFDSSFQTLAALREGKALNRHVKVPNEAREYLVLYSGDSQDEFVCDCLKSKDIAVVRSFFDARGITEEEFENYGEHILRDAGAGIETREQLVRVRRLDRSIGESLKKLYKYRCQICANNFGEIRGTDAAESHHVDAFVSSLNNDSDNILIVCPNHHTVIHKAKPVFNRETLSFVYPNGFEETLRLNKHLKGAG